MARLTRRARLRGPRRFQQIIEAGRRVRAGPYSAAVQGNEGDGARLGIAIARRNVPRAVDRNRLKREIRESFRAHHARLPPVDLVIFTRGEAVSMPASERRRQLEQLWERLAQTGSS